MKEILVHFAAPSSRKDDERYRRLAEAYDDFEPATTINCSVLNGEDSAVVAGSSRTLQASHYGLCATPARNEALSEGALPRGVTERDSSSAVKETPIAAGFVAPTQIIPASRKSTAKSKKMELFAQAPDFGSFASTSLTPIQKIDEAERRWLHQQRPSTKSPGSGLPKTSTPGKVPHPLFIEDTQQALAAMEDHFDSSSFGGWPTSSPEESPITQKSSKRRCPSSNPSPAEASRTDQHVENQMLDLPPAPSTWHPPPRTPPRDDMSSQMPDDYNLSDSESSPSRVLETPRPSVEGRVGFDESLSVVREQAEQEDSNSSGLLPAAGDRPSQDSTKDLSQQSQLSMLEESDNVLTKKTNVENESRANQDTSLAFQMAAQTSTPASAQTQEPRVSDFASLPLQIWSPPPAIGRKRKFDEMTSMLETYSNQALVEFLYRPASVSRAIDDAERGCWIFDTSAWEPKRQHEFWTRMQRVIGEGKFGSVWCQRNVAKDWGGGTDGNEDKGLGVVWLFCWGQVVPHIWVGLYVESHKQIRKSKAQWAVGRMEDLEVVVQMR